MKKFFLLFLGFVHLFFGFAAFPDQAVALVSPLTRATGTISAPGFGDFSCLLDHSGGSHQCAQDLRSRFASVGEVLTISTSTGLAPIGGGAAFGLSQTWDSALPVQMQVKRFRRLLPCLPRGDG